MIERRLSERFMNRHNAGLCLSIIAAMLAMPAVASSQACGVTPGSGDATCAILADAAPRPVSEAERRRAIAALEARLAAAQAQIAGEVAILQERLAAVREALVADLAARDPAYAEEIADFHRDVTGIASSPEGLQALARYNAGDRVGAIAALDQLRQARTAGRQARADIESAAEARQIARLALDAQGKNDPAFDAAALIIRYEEVVRLDPTNAGDWRRLAALYRSVGRSADAEAADARAEVLATSE